MTFTEITLPVTGMTCAMCVKNVERSLKKLKASSRCRSIWQPKTPPSTMMTAN